MQPRRQRAPRSPLNTPNLDYAHPSMSSDFCREALRSEAMLPTHLFISTAKPLNGPSFSSFAKFHIFSMPIATLTQESLRQLLVQKNFCQIAFATFRRLVLPLTSNEAFSGTNGQVFR